MWQSTLEQDSSSLIKQENFLVPKEKLISLLSSAYIGIIHEWLEKDYYNSI